MCGGIYYHPTHPAISVTCSVCGALPKQPCKTKYTHGTRVDRWFELQERKYWNKGDENAGHYENGYLIFKGRKYSSTGRMI